jgi:hypothetical protein
VLRPFFKPKPGLEASLEADDWEPDLELGKSPGRADGYKVFLQIVILTFDKI